MKIRKIYGCSWLFFTDAITLYPFILFKRPKSKVSKLLDKHEMIHIEQVERDGWLKFYILYLYRSAKCGYYGNEYEKEAYRRQSED